METKGLASALSLSRIQAPHRAHAGLCASRKAALELSAALVNTSQKAEATQTEALLICEMKGQGQPPFLGPIITDGTTCP